MGRIVILFLLSSIALDAGTQSGATPPLPPLGLPVITTNSAAPAPPRPQIAPPAQSIPFPRPPEQRVQQAFPAPNARGGGQISAPQGGPNPYVPARSEPAEPEALKWDAVVKEYTAKAGEVSAHMMFAFTNVSSSEVVINWVRTSCGCTLAKLPPVPWHVPPGEKGEIAVTMDLRGKVGTLSKIVTVDTSKGPKFLTVTAHIPAGAMAGGMDTRTRNMELAKVDRQIVFKNDCATCHAEPAKDKHGEALYAAACAICHDSPHRATMVPDLRALKITPTPEYWKAWISNGKPGSLMPAFAKSQDGILDEKQIDSLVEYLAKNFPPKQAPAAPAGASSVAAPAGGAAGGGL